MGCNGGGGGTGGGTSTATGTATATATGTTAVTATTAAADLPPQDPCEVEHGPGWATFDGDSCACLPGRTLCGSDCVDLASDATHCGTCNTACRPGLSCVLGTCGGLLPSGSPVIRRLSGGDPQAACSWATEAVPEVSVNAAPGEPDAAVAYLLFSADAGAVDAYYNWRLPSGDWTTPLHLSPDAPMGDGATDPWSATHGGTGTEYFVFQGPSGNSLLLAWGTTPAQLAQQGPPTMPPRILVSGLADGPSLVPDLGAPAIYLAYQAFPAFPNPGGPPRSLLRRYAPCEAADLGGPGCPEAWPEPVEMFSPLPAAAGHVSVAVNPCTHHAIAAVARVANDEYRAIYLFIDTSGGFPFGEKKLDALPVASNGPCAGKRGIPRCNTGTPDCGDFFPCLQINRRVHLAARYDPEDDRCLLYAAYDVVSGDEAFVRLSVLDVTDESLSGADALVERVDSHGPGQAHRDFLGTVAVDGFTGGVGVFFYRQEDGDPCTTRYLARVRGPDDVGFSEVPLAGPFPTIEDPHTGSLGHYVRAAGFSRPGTLLASWAQPVPTADPACTPCQGGTWSLATFGAEVMP